MISPEKYMKALVAAIIATLNVLYALTATSGIGLDELSHGDWIAATIAFLTTFTGVWAAPKNKNEDEFFYIKGVVEEAEPPPASTVTPTTYGSAYRVQTPPPTQKG